MRQLAYEYYMNNGTLDGIQNADVGVDGTCASTNFYKYGVWGTSTFQILAAFRCTSGSGGKTPNASREYRYFMQYYPGTGQSIWYCDYTDNSSPCFGLPAWS